MMLDKERYDRALALLREAYPEVRPALVYSSPFELLVSTMLAAQCTDRQVNKCTALLYKTYNTPAQFASLTEAELEPYIKSCGFFHTKGRNIIAMSRILMAEYGGEVPKDRDALTRLPGVGRKTANVVVSNAFGIPAIAVDTHVFRVTNRIGLADAKNVEKTEAQLMEHIPKADWSDAHHWLIYHGRQVCDAKKPKCAQCCVACVCDTWQRAAE